MEQWDDDAAIRRSPGAVGWRLGDQEEPRE